MRYRTWAAPCTNVKRSPEWQEQLDESLRFLCSLGVNVIVKTKENKLATLFKCNHEKIYFTDNTDSLQLACWSNRI